MDDGTVGVDPNQMGASMRTAREVNANDEMSERVRAKEDRCADEATSGLATLKVEDPEVVPAEESVEPQDNPPADEAPGAPEPVQEIPEPVQTPPPFGG